MKDAVDQVLPRRSRPSFSSDGIRPQQRVHRDGAACAGDAGADLLVALLLMITEEDVAMVDLAIDGDHVDGAEAAFAALAIVHDVVAAGVEDIKHRALAWDLQLDI